MEYPALPTERATKDKTAIATIKNSQMLPTFRALMPRFCDVLFMDGLIAQSGSTRCPPAR